MSPDLTTRIRDYAVSLELEAPPLTPEEAQERAGSAPTRLISQPRWPTRPRMAVLVAAAAAIILIGVPVLLLSGPGTPPTTTSPFGTETGGTWERTEFAPGVAVKDLATTGFGLVAAAGNDGVWISSDAVNWSQVLVGPYEPPVAPAPTPAPPLTAPPAEPVVSTHFQAVLEFEGRLYAFGRIWVTGWPGVTPADPELPQEGGVFVWSSDDGLTWERTAVGPFPQLIDAVATDDGVFLFGRDVGEGGDDRLADLSTSIVRSTDGTTWEPVAANGLEGMVLWAIAPSEDGFVALGEYRTTNLASIFTSTDGITWLEVGRWRISPSLNYSAWPQVDLFVSPFGIVAVNATEDQPPLTEIEPSQIMIAVSTDGATFSVIDADNPTLLIDNVRDERWPPLTPPEGTVFQDRVIMVGVSYPSRSGEASYQQWTAPLEAIMPPAATDR